MKPLLVAYVRAALVYLVLGTATGVILAIPAGKAWLESLGGRPGLAHAHLNLVGFMSFLIFGISYHILPRFSGRDVYSWPLVRVQFWVANVGVVGMAAAFLDGAWAGLLPWAAGVLFIAFAIFAYNLWASVRPLGR
ncbi:MAG: cbb3-type cytochrome c oxidase subunit I [Thermaerobacter sp.]|nr:cbb3-type cytochrome c oxidase subunit I [Thermaerobacter sp.]MDA8146526.1 cbb3-type cytochrome c oxidase subunit I [Thermaerobacter sp.]